MSGNIDRLTMNIVSGEPLTDETLDALAAWLTPLVEEYVLNQTGRVAAVIIS